MLLELINTKTMNLATLFILLILGYVMVILTKRATNDLYDGISSRIRKWWKMREAISTSDPELTEGEEANAEDWSKSKATVEIAKWVVGVILILAAIDAFGIFMRPVLWTSVEYFIYGAIAFINLLSLLFLGLLSFFYSAYTGESLGVGKTIRSRSNLFKGIFLIVISFQFFVESTGDLSVYKKLASQYCLTDLPGMYDRFKASRILGISMDELEDQQVRTIMRDLHTEDLIASGQCLR